MNVLAFPFNFDSANPGALNYVEQGLADHKAQEIKSFFLTHKKERPIYADYGMDDPAFARLDETEFASEFALFYQGKIELTEVQVLEEDNFVIKITVGFI